jgi:hypothetical protein
MFNDSPSYYANHDYANGDKYVGEFMYDQPNGYGVYTWENGKTYKGYFMEGISYGTGTIECNRYISKGKWFNEMQHGEFYKTDKLRHKTYLEYWKMNKLIKSQEIQYIAPKYLYTLKRGVSKEKSKKLVQFESQEKKCVGCYDKIANVAVVPCGHVVMCIQCLDNCTCCPICRCAKKGVLKLYIA